MADQQDQLKEPRPAADPSPVAAPPLAAAAARAPAPGSTRLARSAFIFMGFLISAVWFVEPFVAAAELRIPQPAVVGTVLLLAASFCASIHLLQSSVVRRPPPAAAAQSEAVGVGAVAIAVAVVVGTAAFVVATCGDTYGYPPARS